MPNDLSDKNFLIYAAKAYDRPSCIQSEFEEDLNRIQYIKRLLTKYYSTKVLKDRLIMNHLIIFYNVFGVEAATKMLFYRLEKRDLEVIKPFLLLLNYLPTVVAGIDGRTIITSDIKLDKGAVKALRQI